MRRRAIKDGDWQKRVWGNYPGLNTFALGVIKPRGIYGIPQLETCETIPDQLFPFEEKSKWKTGSGAIHFYCEDHYLNSIWVRAARAPHMPGVVKKSGMALTPDFSIFSDYPKAINAWNVYRARLLGALWAHCGVQVIPSLMWGDPLTHEGYLFDGLPNRGVFAISAGHIRDDEATFKAFFLEFLSRFSPSTILVYGRGLSPWIEDQGIPIKRYDSRLTQIYKQRRSTKRA